MASAHSVSPNQAPNTTNSDSASITASTPARTDLISEDVPVPRTNLPTDLQRATDQQLKYAYRYVMTADPKQALASAGYNSKWSPTRPLHSATVKSLVRFFRDQLAQSLPAPSPEQIINRLAKRVLAEGVGAPSDRGLKDLSGELREWMGHGQQKGTAITIVLPDTYKQFGLPVNMEVSGDGRVGERLTDDATIIEETEDDVSMTE